MRAWLACAVMYPSGTRSATHTTPLPHLPLGTISMNHVSCPSEIEKPSIDDA